MRDIILWGVYNPKGKLLTVQFTKQDAKVSVFDSHDNEFRTKYWKQMELGWTAARREGWRIEKGCYKPLEKPQ